MAQAVLERDQNAFAALCCVGEVVGIGHLADIILVDIAQIPVGVLGAGLSAAVSDMADEVDAAQAALPASVLEPTLAGWLALGRGSCV